MLPVVFIEAIHKTLAVISLQVINEPDLCLQTTQTENKNSTYEKGGSDEPPQIPSPYGPGDTINMRGFLQ